MRDRILTMLGTIEGVPLSLVSFVVSLLAIVGGRIVLENFLESFPFYFADNYFYQFTHHFFTFLLIFLAALLVFRWTSRVSITQAANVLLFGFFLIWTPPIVDEIISRGKGLWSFYAFDGLAGLWQRYLTFFGDRPDIGITYGIRVEIAFAVIGLIFYAWFKTRKILRAFIAAGFLYTALFVIGVFPSFIAIATRGMETGFMAVDKNDIAGLMLSPTPLFGLTPPNVASSLNVKMSLVFSLLDFALIALILFVFFRPIFLALLKNARLPQLCYHAGLLLLGGLLVFVYGTPVFVPDFFHFLGLAVLIAAVSCAWLASVVVNDLHDEAIDALTNADRPLPGGLIPRPLYQTIGMLFFAASLLLAMLVSTQAGLLLAAYQGLAWLYSASPLRLKRFPIIASLIAGLASLLVFFAGYVVFNESKSVAGLPWQIPLFLLVTYTLLLPIKDFKDMAGDRADGVLTLPVLLGETAAKRLLGIALFALFVGSVFILNVERLFPLALLFGTLAYWLLHVARPSHRSFSYRSLPGWYMILATAYGFFLLSALLPQH